MIYKKGIVCVFWCACLSINVLIFLEHENIQRQLAMDQHKSTSILSYSTYINDPFTTHPTTLGSKQIQLAHPRFGDWLPISWSFILARESYQR